jgi:hypothetical protein
VWYSEARRGAEIKEAGMTARPLTRKGKRSALLWALLPVLFCAGEARAADAIVSTLICEPLSKGAPVHLTPADDSPLYLSIKDRMKRAVERAGHPVQDATPLQLYYSAVESAVEVREQGPTLGQLDVRTVNREARAQLLVNVWSSSKDSLVGGRKSKSGVSVSNYLIMALELNREDNGRCVWRGEGAVELEGVTAEQAAKVLTDAIAARMGQTIDRVMVPLQ